MPDVAGTNEVSGLLVAAFDTGEAVLRWSVALIHHPALRAPLTRVPGVDQDHRNAGPQRLVRQELPELGEGPTGVSDALRLPNLRPLADMRQVFQPDAAAGAFGVRNNLLGNKVVGVSTQTFRVAGGASARRFR